MTTADHPSTTNQSAPTRRRGVSTDATSSSTGSENDPGGADIHGAHQIRLEDVPVLIELPDLTRNRQESTTAKTATSPQTEPFRADAPRREPAPIGQTPVGQVSAERIALERIALATKASERPEGSIQKSVSLEPSSRENTRGERHSHEPISEQHRPEQHRPEKQQHEKQQHEKQHPGQVADGEPLTGELSGEDDHPRVADHQSHRELADQRKKRREAVLAEGDRRASFRLHAIGGLVVIVVAVAAFLAFQQNQANLDQREAASSDQTLDGVPPIIDLAVDEGRPIDPTVPPALPTPFNFPPSGQQTAQVTELSAGEPSGQVVTAKPAAAERLQFGRESDSAELDRSTTQRVSFGQPRSAEFTSSNEQAPVSKLGTSDDDRLGNVASLPDRPRLGRQDTGYGQFDSTSNDGSESPRSSDSWRTGTDASSRYEPVQENQSPRTGGSYPVFELPSNRRGGSFAPTSGDTSASGYDAASSTGSTSGYDAASRYDSASRYDAVPGSDSANRFEPASGYETNRGYQPPNSYPRTGVNGASAPSSGYPSTATQPGGWSYPASGTRGASPSSAPVQGQPAYPRTNW